MSVRITQLSIRAFAAFLVVVLSGCAGYSIKDTEGKEGYVVYKPVPYLLVTRGTSETSASIVWLPDYDHGYRVDTWNFLGKADFEFEFTNGWQLTSIADKSDNTTIPSDILGILKERGTESFDGDDFDFELYRIDFDNDELSLMQKTGVESQQDDNPSGDDSNDGS